SVAAVVNGGHGSMRRPDLGARTFTQERRAGFADCAPSGRMRLDAIARWIQDAAYADIADAALDQVAVWVVRRAQIRVNHFPRFGERFRVTTFCSGVGRMWAERRTDVARADADPGQLDVEAVGLWVHLDPVKARPFPLIEAELDTYGGVEPLRRVTARLRHPGPPGIDSATPWQFRATECDVAGHVNNAAYWQPLEEELISDGREPERIDAEIEFRTPSQPGRKLVVASGDRRWILDEQGEAHASIALLGVRPQTRAEAVVAPGGDGG
ncbi:MAG: acyl-ACP thioesterase domain-containing protein, partial [Solirubrobacteraceae bacterium]